MIAKARQSEGKLDEDRYCLVDKDKDKDKGSELERNFGRRGPVLGQGTWGTVHLHRKLKGDDDHGDASAAVGITTATWASEQPEPELLYAVKSFHLRAKDSKVSHEQRVLHEFLMGERVGNHHNLLGALGLFQGKNEITQLSAIFSLLGMPSRETWPEFKSLPNSKALAPLLNTSHMKSKLTLTKYPYLTNTGLALLTEMLSLNPASRPSAADILSHPYFKEDPRPKAREMFPTFPSKAGQGRRRRRASLQAPERGAAPKFAVDDLAHAFENEEAHHGAGFALRME